MDEPDWVLLERVAVGNGTDADRVAVEQWIGGDPERQRLFDSLARIAEGTRRLNVGPPFDPTGSLGRARARLGLGTAGATRHSAAATGATRHSTTATGATPHAATAPGGTGHSAMVTGGTGRSVRAPLGDRGGGRPPRSERWPVAAIAAGLLVCLGVGLAVGLGHRRREAPRLYATARGQRATLRLDDGTQVVLAPASHLSVAGRTATLDGEAFFVVVHDPKAPFVVHAGRAVATDIGTRFDVRAYPEDGTVRIAVEDGQVALTAADSERPVSLAEGDVATLRATGQPAVAHGVEISGISAWTAGRLEFHGTPVREAVVALARWYDIDLRIGDSSLAALPLTASFRDEPVNEVLHIVAVTLGARVHWDGRTVFLRKS